MENMKLFKRDGLWVIKTDDESSIELKGTNIISTPFNAVAEAWIVLKTMKQVYPDVNMIIDEVLT